MTDTISQPRPSGRSPRRPARALRVLPAITLLAVLTITASAEYELARTVLDLPPHIAWAVPVAIDSYVLAALRSRRDVAPALAVMAGALTASMGAHLAGAARGGTGLPGTLAAPLATAVMIVLVVVAWRVHVLIDHPQEATPAPSNTPDPAGTPSPVSTPPPPRSGAAPAAPDTPAPDAAVVAAPVARPSYADRAPTSSVPTAAPVTSPAASSTAASDADILAAIDGRSPGVRALMRIHGIGQTRATRLHRQATSQTASQTTTDRAESAAAPPEIHTEEEQTRRPTNRKDQEAQMSQTTNEHPKINTKNDEQGTEEVSRGNGSKIEENTHTCITDRMGKSRSTLNGVDLDLDGDAVAHPGVFTGVPVDLAPTAASRHSAGAGER